jgi:hypothetical protein
MALVFALTLPGLVVALVALGAVDRLLLRRRGPALTTAAWGELDAGLDPGRRHAIDELAAAAVRRDVDDAAAPPHSRVDLDAGRAFIRV